MISFILAVLITRTASLPNLKPVISQYLDFSGSYFFCDIGDATTTLNYRQHYIKANILSEKTNFDLVPGHLQKIGVFLDLSCEEGYDFLNENLNSFNGTYRWLIWSEDVERILEFLRPSRLSIDSDVILMTTGIRIYDLYRVHQSLDIEKTEIGFLSDVKLETIPRPSRTDFKQFVFNASLMMTTIKFNLSNLIPPLLDRSYKDGVDTLRRYGLSLYIHMAERYNFSMNYKFTKAWGDFVNGSWTGMVGQVFRGEAEFGTSPTKFKVERMGIVDFISSISIVKVCFTFLQPTLFGTYKALVLPLDPIVWACLGVCSFIGVITFMVVSKYDKTSTCNDNLGGSLLLVLSSLAQQGFPDNSYKLSTRIIYISLLFVTFFTAVYYNTAILNGLLLQSPNAIQNIDQLLKSDIDIAIMEGPYMRNEIDVLNDTYTILMRKKLKKIKDPKKHFLRAEEAVKRMKKGKFAYYTEEKVVYAEIMNKMSDAEICSLSEIEKYRPFHCGGLMRKNSPYKEHFNRGFTAMREVGVMKRTQDHWFAKKPECHWKQDTLSLGLEPLALAYLVLILGYIFALLAFYFERFRNPSSPIIFKQKGIKIKEKLTS